MTTLSEPPVKAPGLHDRIALTDVDGRPVKARRLDTGEPVDVLEILTATHLVGTTTAVPPCPVYADRRQLARIVAGLMHLGDFAFGPGFVNDVIGHGDPNDDMGSGALELGGYDLDE